MSIPSWLTPDTPDGNDLIRYGADNISRNAQLLIQIYEDLEQKINDARWARDEVLDGTIHIDELYTPDTTGRYRITLASVANGFGLPEPGPGAFTVHWIFGVGTPMAQHVWEPNTGGRYVRARNSGVWGPWTSTRWHRGRIPAGTDVNDMWGPQWEGIWTLSNQGEADAVDSMPFSGPGTFIVYTTPNGVTTHTANGYGLQAGTWKRYTLGVGNRTWTSWDILVTASEVQTMVDAAVADINAGNVGLFNTLLIEDWSRRRGGRKTLSTGAVALRFDHGLRNFDEKVRPLLEAHDLPYSLALCSQHWGHAENTGITPAIVDGWVQGGLCEVWNHSRSHGGHPTVEGAAIEIIQGLTELSDQLPSAEIDGFVIPGTGGTGFGPGFVSGQRVDEFFNSPGGRMILGHHAISTGYIADTDHRTLDGIVRQGQAHRSMDSMTAPQVINEITTAQENLTGLQLMLHPSVVDSTGYLPSAALTQILDYIATERDAGRLAVLGPYDLMLADTSAARANDGQQA